MIEGIFFSGIAFVFFLVTHGLYFHYVQPAARWKVVMRIAEIFFIFYTIVFFSLPFFNVFTLMANSLAAKIAAYINGAVLYIFLFFSYAQIYFLVDRSISARIMTDIIEMGGSATREQIRKQYSSEALQQRRLDDMLYGGYVKKENGQYVLTAKGRRNARVFLWCKKYLRLYPGG
jgi:signal transduction histidine kinase